MSKLVKCLRCGKVEAVIVPSAATGRPTQVCGACNAQTTLEREIINTSQDNCLKQTWSKETGTQKERVSNE